MRRTMLVLVVCAFGLGALAFAQVPQKISYQGLLQTSLGTPVQDGSYDIRFDLYTLPSGGVQRYTQTKSGVSVARGTFSVILGPLPGVFRESLYVEVTLLAGPGISSSVTFLPRSELTSAPYALRADTANFAAAALPGGPAGGDLTGVFPNPSIASGAVTLAKINPAGSINGQAIISTGTSSVPTWGNVAPGPHTHDASEITSGVLAASHGGTNNSSLGTDGAVAYSDGIKYAFTTGVGSNGQSLKSSGGGAPTWGAVNLSSPGEVTGTLLVGSGGTGATTPGGARVNLGAAASGANADITALSGLLTPLSIAQGGTGSSSQNFVDLAGTQSIAGAKTFSNPSNSFAGNGSNLSNLSPGNMAAGTAGIDISGNAATVTNGVYTSGLYNDPVWLNTLAGAKITGSIGGNAANVNGTVGIGNGGTGATSSNSARLNLGAAASGSNNDITSMNGLLTPLSVAQGGTGAVNASNARTNLAAAASGSNSDITALNNLAVPLSVVQGGTGATNSNTARSNLGAAASGVNNDITTMNGLSTPLAANEGGTGISFYAQGDLIYATNSTTLAKLSDVPTGNALISGGTAAPPSWGKVGLSTHVSGTLPVANGGTNATNPGNARANLGAAASGVNSDIMSITGLTTPLSMGQGGTGASTAAGARSNLGAAASGNNSDITSITGLITPLAVNQGGTGSSAQNFVDLTTVQSVNGNKTFSGNTTFQGSVTVGAGPNPGTPLLWVWSATANLGFPMTMPQSNSDMFVNVQGAVPGDVVMLGVPNGSVLPNSDYTAWVSAPNIVTVRFNNYSLAPLGPPMGLFRVAVMRF